MNTSGGIHAYLSDSSYEAWQRLAKNEGVTITALLEAIGLHLTDPTLRDPALRAIFAPVIADAQRITIERRRRRP